MILPVDASVLGGFAADRNWLKAISFRQAEAYAAAVIPIEREGVLTAFALFFAKSGGTENAPF
jgi:hypothetical protein